MNKISKIEAIDIRANHLGLTAVVCSEGYCYAVRYAPDTVVTEALIRKSWRESRRSFRPYDWTEDEFIG